MQIGKFLLYHRETNKNDEAQFFVQSIKLVKHVPH